MGYETRNAVLKKKKAFILQAVSHELRLSRRQIERTPILDCTGLCRPSSLGLHFRHWQFSVKFGSCFLKSANTSITGLLMESLFKKQFLNLILILV